MAKSKAPASGAVGEKGRRWPVAWLVGGPAFLLLVVAMLPLISGARTLFLRDVFALHLPLKGAQAQSLTALPASQEGLPSLPLVAPELAGGQPLLGNLNGAPLYPDNLLYLVAPFLWAFNAHFWIHFLLAPLAMAWLAREWGLRTEGAAAAGVAYGASGYLLSQLNLYNLVAGVALAPALVAAVLRLTAPAPQDRAPRRWRWFLAVALLWALEVLAGDPVIALQALLLAGLAAVVRGWRQGGAERWRHGLAVTAAVAVGTLLAAPQWIETLRILPFSYRGHQGFSAATAGVASFDPRQILELCLPLAFGRPDVVGEGAFWGGAYHDGFLPLYLTLYPGWAVLLLVALSGLAVGRSHLWGWLLVVGGVFCALGAWNPLVKPLLAWSGGLFRYPIKFWLPVAVGAALLAGLGLERLLGREGEPADRLRRWALRGLAGVAGVYLALAALLTLVPEGAAAVLTNAGVPPEHAAAEVVRWCWRALATVAVLAALAGALRLFSRYPRWGTALWLAVHAGSQLALLWPVMATDESAFYRQPPAALAAVPPEARVVAGREPWGLRGHGLGVSPSSAGSLSAARGVRRLFTELSPAAGALFPRRYELNTTAEGLSSFLTQASVQSLGLMGEPQRLRLLAAWGVDRLVLPVPLAEEAPGEVRRLWPQGPAAAESVYVYEIRKAMPEVAFVHRLIFAPHLNAALGSLVAPGFDVSTTAVLPGDGAPREGRPGSLLRSTVARETLEAEVESPDGGALVWQRAHLGLYRAAIDGEAVPVEIANLHRIGVRVPPGRHQVRVWVDRRSLSWGFVLSLLGVAGLVVARGWFRRMP
jgi:hypothetical protein